MNLFTEGHVTVTPIRLGDDRGLEDLQDVLAEQLYTGDIPSSGWAALNLTEGTPALRPRHAPGVPEVIDLGEHVGPALAARLVFDVYRRPRFELPDELTEAEEVERTFEHGGVDLLVFGSAGAYRLLVSSQNSKDVALVRGALGRALDTGGRIPEMLTPDPRLEPDPDLFLWLFHHTETDGELNNRLQLEGIRTIQARNGQSNRTRALDFPDTDREEVLARACDEFSTLGPAVLEVNDSRTGLNAEFMFQMDGTFAAHVTRSSFAFGLDPGSPLGRVLLASYVANQVIPALRRAHAADAGWHSGGRQEFRKAARAKLATTFAT